MEKEDYLEKCKELLIYFGKDVTKNTISVHDGDNSCIMNPKSDFYELFGGHSIRGVAEFYAKETNKKLKYT